MGFIRLFWLRSRLLLLVLVLPLILSAPHSAAEPQSLWDDADLQNLEPEIIDVIKFRRRPILNSYWETIPSIRICSDSGVSSARASQAMSFWQKLGYPLENLFFDDGSVLCNVGGVRGEITVMLVNSDVPIGNSHLAITRTWHNNINNTLTRAQIYVFGGLANKPRLLEHELGHALGWGHYNRYLHVMNSEYRLTGMDTNGLTWGEYVSDTERLKGL